MWVQQSEMVLLLTISISKHTTLTKLKACVCVDSGSGVFAAPAGAEEEGGSVGLGQAAALPLGCNWGVRVGRGHKGRAGKGKGHRCFLRGVESRQDQRSRAPVLGRHGVSVAAKANI